MRGSFGLRPSAAYRLRQPFGFVAAADTKAAEADTKTCRASRRWHENAHAKHSKETKAIRWQNAAPRVSRLVSHETQARFSRQSSPEAEGLQTAVDSFAQLIAPSTAQGELPEGCLEIEAVQLPSDFQRIPVSPRLGQLVGKRMPQPARATCRRPHATRPTAFSTEETETTETRSDLGGWLRKNQSTICLHVFVS